MAILKSSFEEPLLTREQSSVVRAIAHAAQLTEAFSALKKTQEIILNEKSMTLSSNDNIPSVLNYLQAEVERVLMQIKTPKKTPTPTLAKVDPMNPSTKAKI